MAWNYSEKTQKLFMDAVQGKPGTHLGEISDPDGFGEHGSIACGDAMRFTFRVERHPSEPLKDIIKEAKYLTFGCTSAIAASEALCTLIEEGQYTPIEALQIQNQDIVKYLDGLPDQKIHCSVMGAEALEAAVFNWAQKRNVDLSALGIELFADEKEEGRVVCKCFSLSEPYLKRRIKELGLRTIPEVTHAIKAGGACMACHHLPGGLQDLIDEVWRDETPPVGLKQVLPIQEAPAPATVGETAAGDAEPPADDMSPYRFCKLVDRTVDEYIRPFLKQDGGDMEVVDIKDKLVYCRLKGACAGCAGAKQTLHMMVERVLKERVHSDLRVIEVD